MKNIEKIIHNNIDITLVKTDKFKSLSACVVFLGEFNGNIKIIINKSSIKYD